MVGRSHQLFAALVAAAAVALASLVGAGAGSAGRGTGNLLRNPGAEAGPAAADEIGIVQVPGWKTSSSFTAVRYGAANFGHLSDPRYAAQVRGGRNFFAGGPATDRSEARQIVDVRGYRRDVDGRRLRATLTGQIGGSPVDTAVLEAIFLGSTGRALGRLRIAVGIGDLGPDTKLVPRSRSGRVPRGTRRIAIVMTAAVGPAGGSYADAYFDNLGLTLSPARM